MSAALNASPARTGTGAAPIVAAPIVKAAPTPADKAPAPGAPPPASRFAELLRRSRAEAPAPAPAPVATPSPRDEAADGTDPQKGTTTESKTVSANAAKARAAMPKRATAMAVVENGAQASEQAQSEIDDDSAAAQATALPGDRFEGRAAAAMALEARRSSLRASGSESDNGGGVDSGDRGDCTGAPKGRQQSLGHARGMANVDSADEPRTEVAEASRDAALQLGADPAFHTAVAEQAPLPGAASTRSPVDRAGDALTASLAAGATTRLAEAPTAPSTALSLALSTPLDAPDFAARLGVQVSLLAHDGVQQAELHLNPAEMGPVSIHISLEGKTARVDFGADAAATREAIERGLPELASALREAGFTLAGGGVSQHAHRRSTGEDDPGRGARRVNADGSPASPAVAGPAGRVVRASAAGGVDVYA